jgi:hypothetical protein
MSQILRRIKAFSLRLKEARRERGTLLPAWKEAYGETPAVTFDDLVEIYLGDYAAKAAVDFLADQAVGGGFYTTVNRDYAEADETKRVIDDFNENVNLDALLQVGAREIVAFGNSFWEKITSNRLENLKILPITSVEKVLRDAYGEVRGYKQTASYGGKTLAPQSIIHFCWNPVNDEPFGTGILRALAEKLTVNGETRESLIAVKARLEKVMPEIFEKYAGPDELWIFEGVGDDKLAEYQRLIKEKPKAGARFVYNRSADVKTVAVDPRARFDSYVEHLINQFYLGLQTPLPKLFTTPGFTEASAKAAIEMAERKVVSLQRFIKRVVEREIFRPVIRQAGLDPEKADVRLNWGSPQVLETRIEDILKAAELGFVRREELRKMLTKKGWELWETEEDSIGKATK